MIVLLVLFKADDMLCKQVTKMR